MRELVLGALSATDKQLLRDGETPRHERSTTSGPLRPEVVLRRREILVRQDTPAAWRSHVAWHVYWKPHGGCGGANLDNKELRAASPPTPRYDDRVTWGQARKWVREEAADHAAGAGAPGDTSRVDAGAQAARATGPRAYDLAAVCSEQALTCPVNGARCESIACIDVGCTAEDANVDAERAA